MIHYRVNRLRTIRTNFRALRHRVNAQSSKIFGQGKYCNLVRYEYGSQIECRGEIETVKTINRSEVSLGGSSPTHYIYKVCKKCGARTEIV